MKTPIDITTSHGPNPPLIWISSSSDTIPKYMTNLGNFDGD